MATRQASVTGIKFVTCPCCHGEKVMKVYEPTSSFETMHTFTVVPCCHCEGKGMVPAEIEEAKR